MPLPVACPDGKGKGSRSLFATYDEEHNNAVALAAYLRNLKLSSGFRDSVRRRAQRPSGVIRLCLHLRRINIRLEAGELSFYVQHRALDHGWMIEQQRLDRLSSLRPIAPASEGAKRRAGLVNGTGQPTLPIQPSSVRSQPSARHGRYGRRPDLPAKFQRLF